MYFNNVFLLFFYRWKQHASGNVSLSLTIFFCNLYYSIKFFLETFNFLSYGYFLFFFLGGTILKYILMRFAQTSLQWAEYYAVHDKMQLFIMVYNTIKLN